MSVARRKWGVVIGERRLTVRDAPGEALTVSLGKPRRTKGEKDWECAFRIMGTGMATVEYGYGVDAIQALTSALEGIRVVLNETGKSLSWAGVLPDETGFQRMIPMLDADFARRINRVVDQELARHVQRLRRRHLQKKRASPKKDRPLLIPDS